MPPSDRRIPVITALLCAVAGLALQFLIVRLPEANSSRRKGRYNGDQACSQAKDNGSFLRSTPAPRTAVVLL